MYKVIQYTFFPLTIAAVIVLTWLWLINSDEDFFVVIPIVLSLGMATLFVLAERLMPYKQAWNINQKDALTDGIQTFLVLPAASKLAEFILPVLMYYPVIWLAEYLDFRGITDLTGFWTQFVISLLACELSFYWYHRCSHLIPFFWRFHAVHHGAKRVYWLNSGRFHPIGAFSGCIFYFLPIALLNPQKEISVMIISLSAVSGFLEHVNIDFKAGILNYIFNSAELHRWHHSKVIDESNKNYGKVLSVWDLVFGSFFMPKNRHVSEVGITGGSVPADLVGQLKYPFSKH